MTIPPKLPASEKKTPTATEVTVSNLSLPGSGTMLAGQKFHGACQLATAAAGFIMTIYFAAWFGIEWVQSGVFPATAISESERVPDSWIAPLLVGLGGVFLFVCALGWAFLTSLVIGKQLQRRQGGN